MRLEHATLTVPRGVDRRVIGMSVHVISVRSANYYVDHYQQYLAKNPFGYRCHANTGVKFPG
jgi:peptide-methionine (S)-S-oxide reductase